MKNRILLILIMLMVAISVIGQNINCYKYVYVPDLIYETGVDIYGISAYTREQLTNIGFKIIEYNNPPDDVLENKCSLLNCVLKTSKGQGGYGIITGTVEISLVNCENSTVFKGSGTTWYGSQWKVVYQKSVERALSEMNYKYNPNSYYHDKQSLFPIVEKTHENEETIKEYLTSNKTEPIEGIYKSFQNDQTSYYKLGIIKHKNLLKAIIIESNLNQWKAGEVKAIFEQSSMKDLYSVKWYMANKTQYETFGILENEGFLSIDFKDIKSGEKRQDKFIKMFPQIDTDFSFNKKDIKSSGSGFFVTANGIIATNAHVIEDASNIEIYLSNDFENFTHKAKVLLADNKNDVALLQIDDENFKEITTIPYVINEKSEVGEKVFTIGYPLNDVMGVNYKVTDGIISSKTGIDDDVRYYQISVPLHPGNSGGPLFNKEGNIIGITTARLNSDVVGAKIENVNYAIKISYLLNLYNMLPNASSLNTTPKLSNKELQEQVKILKNYVCLIKVN